MSAIEWMLRLFDILRIWSENHWEARDSWDIKEMWDFLSRNKPGKAFSASLPLQSWSSVDSLWIPVRNLCFSSLFTAAKHKTESLTHVCNLKHEFLQSLAFFLTSHSLFLPLNLCCSLSLSLERESLFRNMNNVLNCNFKHEYAWEVI